VDDELRFHFTERVEELVAAGMAEAEARALAEDEFGDVAATRERLRRITGRLEARRARHVRWDGLRQDVRYALRGARRNPGFTVTVVLTLALGIGAATSMYGLMWRLLIQSPPHVVDPDGVVGVYQRFTGPGQPDRHVNAWTYAFYQHFRSRTRQLTVTGAYLSQELSIGSGVDARRARAVLASGEYWRVLGTLPAAGRFFREEESRPVTGVRVVVLSHDFWRRSFGGSRDVLGRVVEIKSRRYEIIGVAPRGFHGVELEQVDLWLPLFAYADGDPRPATWHTEPLARSLRLVGRRSGGATDALLEAELTTIVRPFFAALNEQYFSGVGLSEFRDAQGSVASIISARGRGIDARPEARVTAWLVGVGVVLLAVSCANVAGLLLLRAMRRRREVAIRTALGMSRRRLTALLLTEATTVAVLGGVAALILFVAGRGWIERLIVPSLVWEPAALVEPWSILVTGSGVIAASLLAGLAALVHARRDVSSALRDGAPHASPRRSLTHTGILVSQGSLSVLLLIGAVLFVRSLRNLLAKDLGVDTRRVLAVHADFSGWGRPAPDVSAFYDRALERIRSLPGVERASLALNAPLMGSARSGGNIYLPGRDSIVTLGDGHLPMINYVGAGFFGVTGMRVLEGREFLEAERDSAPVVVVSESMAKLYWPGQSAVGQCVFVGRERTRCTTVIGVVETQHMLAIREDPKLYWYRPLPSATGPRLLLVRTDPAVSGLQVSIRRALREIEPRLPYIDVRPLAAGLDGELRPFRLATTIFTAFGALAVILSAIGLAAAVAYAVRQRTRELGVRIAVGAGRGQVMWLVLRDGLRIAVIGVAIGVLAALLAAPLLTPYLFEVSARDVVVYAGVGVAVIGVALSASLGPAWRAARVEPVVALRSD
jgi:predicted permease